MFLVRQPPEARLAVRAEPADFPHPCVVVQRVDDSRLARLRIDDDQPSIFVIGRAHIRSTGNRPVRPLMMGMRPISDLASLLVVRLRRSSTDANDASADCDLPLSRFMTTASACPGRRPLLCAQEYLRCNRTASRSSAPRRAWRNRRARRRPETRASRLAPARDLRRSACRRARTSGGRVLFACPPLSSFFPPRSSCAR